MGLLKKFKNIFVEEYEDEEEEIVQMPSSFESRIPTRTESQKVEVNNDVKHVLSENNKPNNIEVPVQKTVVKEPPVHVEEEKVKLEPVQPKKEEKFVFPVYFDESDFGKIENKKEERPKPKMELPKREERIETKEVKKESSYKEAYNNKRATLTEDKKVFKPTPIISPVYGILDKNYYKEDIVVTTSVSRVYSPINAKPMTIDDVRNKAFGTLEDDLADSIVSDNYPEQEESINDENSDAIFNASDFESAIEEDKKRDIAKDGLKSDIESLLNNEEFTSAINFRKTKIEEETKKNEQENKIIPKEDEIEKTEELTETKDNDESNSLIDDIMALAESGRTDEDEIMNNDEEIGNDNEEDELPSSDNDELELPVNITDNEIENAYDDVSDLNDSDLFNLIDSMYDKEDK